MHNAQLKIYNRLNCLGYSNLRQFAIKSNRLILLLIILCAIPIYAQNQSEMSDKSDKFKASEKSDKSESSESLNSQFSILNSSSDSTNSSPVLGEVSEGRRGETLNTQLSTLNSNRWDFLMNWNFMALPYPSYSPETSWQFGITGVWYFHTSKQSTQFSDLNFDMGYTLNRQWYVNANSRIYFNSSTRWYLDAYLSAKHYPDLFFGTTNDIDSVYNPAIRYTSNFVDIQAKPSFYISKHWLVGANLRLRYENSVISHQSTDDSQQTNNFTTETQTTQYCPPVLGGRAQRAEGVDNSSFLIPHSSFHNGFGENIFLGLGGAISYDTRSNNYYPLHGLFFKTTITYYQQFALTDTRHETRDTRQTKNFQLSTFNFQIDLRHYIPLYREFILAWNFRNEWALGNNIPFQLLPTIGGQDLVRGIRQNKFKNNTLFALQAELRIPIWRFLKAAVFGSIGDVYDYNNWHWTTPKIGYGIGLRACIHQAKTNIRFDVARQNYSNDWSFYFTVKEAF